MKLRRKKHDDVFSRLIRERANWQCEACGINKRSTPATLDCAHIFSRRHLATRWHFQNAVALCRSCHMMYTENPFDWADWCRDKFGGDLIAELRQVSHSSVKWTQKQREEIYQHMRGEAQRLNDLRLQGRSGRLEFEAHELMHVFQEAKASA